MNRRNKRKSEYEEEVVSLRRISRMTAGGRRIRFRAVLVLGDRNGKVGIGTAKALDVADAINKAKRRAKKQMIEAPIIDGTIPHKIEVEFGSAKLLLKPAGPGTGLVAGGVVRKALELAGYKNVLSKVLGTDNKMNNLKAAIQALKSLKRKAEEVK